MSSYILVSRSVIILHAVVASLLKEGLTAKDVFYYSPAISFKKILFEQLNNKPWTAVNRCAGILAQHGKAEYVEALISRCLGYCVHTCINHPHAPQASIMSRYVVRHLCICNVIGNEIYIECTTDSPGRCSLVTNISAAP